MSGEKHYPTLKSILYSDDHFTVQYVTHTGLEVSTTVGMFQGCYRFTLELFGTNYHYAGVRNSPAKFFFWLLGEDGKDYELTLEGTPDKMREHWLELHAYTDSFEIPKFEAALPPVTFLQAA